MNPTIAQPALALRDIHLPGAPSLWPPAPGWWVLAALLLALCAWGVPLLLRRRRIRQQRERIFAALAVLQTGLASERSPEQLSRIGELLRRLALMRYPRSEVASLSGGAWLHFLDDTGGDGRFSDGPGRVLADGPYRRQLPPDLDIAGLAALVRGWVEKNAGNDRKGFAAGPEADNAYPAQADNDAQRFSGRSHPQRAQPSGGLVSPQLAVPHRTRTPVRGAEVRP